jgi:hypothetical protein
MKNILSNKEPTPSRARRRLFIAAMKDQFFYDHKLNGSTSCIQQML